MSRIDRMTKEEIGLYVLLIFLLTIIVTFSFVAYLIHKEVKDIKSKGRV